MVSYTHLKTAFAAGLSAVTLATAPAPSQATPQASTPAASTQHEPTSLAEYLNSGKRVFGYQISHGSEAEMSKNLDAYMDQFGGIPGDKPAQGNKPPEVTHAQQLMAAAKLAVGEGFISHAKIDPGTQKPVQFVRDGTAGDKTLNEFELWAHQGERVNTSGTFFSTKLNEVLSGPQSDISYQFANIQTPLDAFQKGSGDCKTSAMERYTLLQKLAAAGEINAGVGDVFLLQLASKKEPEGHVVAGYFDRGRGALLVFDGTGYEIGKDGVSEKTPAVLFEDTKQGRNAVATVGNIKSHVVDNDFAPLYIFTKDGGHFFDLFEPTTNASAPPKMKQPVLEQGKPNPLYGDATSEVVTKEDSGYQKAFTSLPPSPSTAARAKPVTP